jgi:hypothetical protein
VITEDVETIDRGELTAAEQQTFPRAAQPNYLFADGIAQNICTRFVARIGYEPSLSLLPLLLKHYHNPPTGSVILRDQVLQHDKQTIVDR